MAYGSKTLSRKLAALHAAAHTAGTLAPAVAAAIEPKLLPALPPGETLPDTGLLVELLSRELEGLGQEIERLHHRHHHAMAVEKHDRANLRQAAAQLRDALVDVRHIFDHHFGARRSVADFEGREDVHRIPLLSLERIAQGLLAVFDDSAFGWRDYRDPDEVAFVREKLAQRIADYREAEATCRNTRIERTAAAAAAARGYQQNESRIRDLYASLENILSAAGYTSVARQLRPKRPPKARSRTTTRVEIPVAPV